MLVRPIIFRCDLCNYVTTMSNGEAEMFRAVIIGEVCDSRYVIRQLASGVHVTILAEAGPQFGATVEESNEQDDEPVTNYVF